MCLPIHDSRDLYGQPMQEVRLGLRVREQSASFRNLPGVLPQDTSPGETFWPDF
jgi:hypothetical protein